MPCRAPITVDSPAGPIQVRCKQCLQCRIMKQSAVSLRAILEHQTTSSAYFLTLTYADAPETLDYNDFSLFMKRLRIWNSRNQKNTEPIRFLGVGEYGTKLGRPHFHALIYNSNPLPPETLTKLWQQGFVYTGTVTPASIRYTARYCLKFNDRGKESIATWSKRPPLGETGMRLMAAHMRDTHGQIKQVPASLKMGKNQYFLDETMKTVFRHEYEKTGLVLPGDSAPLSHLRYVTDMVLGDPIAKQRIASEDKAKFWETARFSNEQF